ncbi:MAG: hypothetical protein DI564_18300, partial [Rhodanobacter denitrificans]
DIEATLAEIWAEVLRIEQVSVNDNFFELGGHSLLATRLMAAVLDRMGLDIPVRALFETPTLEGFASAVGQAQQRSRPPLEPQVRPERIPLSFGQERLWFLDQLQMGNSAAALRCSGRGFAGGFAFGVGSSSREFADAVCDPGRGWGSGDRPGLWL